MLLEPMLVYNTLTKSLEEFVPNKGREVKMYICGPTVYDSPHIGHARTYISFDIIRRVLSDYFRYDVTFVMNITNIDDKIIKRAGERNITCEELGAQYEKEFLDEMSRLNVRRPDFITRVTEYIPEIVSFIEKLERDGLAYESNESVYFDLAAYRRRFNYNLLRPETCKEDEEELLEKRGREDFVLWKASKENEPMYKSKWGNGRPGWHIECSVMASVVLGRKLDIHAGGVDLAFPHHENEVAQCQGFFGDTWVKYFLHTGHLNIDGLKMSKSLKNFLTIREIVDSSSPQHLRVLFLRHLWNREMSYDPDQLKESDAILKRILNFVSNAESLVKKSDVRSLSDLDKRCMADLDSARAAIDGAFRSNINTPKALDSLLELIAATNKHMKVIHTDVLQMILRYVLSILDVFGLQERQETGGGVEGVAELLAKFRVEVRDLVRSKAEAKAFYQVCDGVRDNIRKHGFIIDDTPEGSILRRIK